jgi:hypothetical protein
MNMTKFENADDWFIYGQARREYGPRVLQIGRWPATDYCNYSWIHKMLVIQPHRYSRKLTALFKGLGKFR